MVNNKIYDVTGWTKNNYSTYINPISLEVKAISNQARKFGQLIIYSVRNIFLKKKNAENEAGILLLDLYLFLKKAL